MRYFLTGKKVRRIIALLSCLALLAGCKPQFTQPRDTAQAEPLLQENSFVSFDGTELPLRTWQPGGGISAAEAIFIALHGFNDYSKFITGAAAYFSRRNIAVFSYDQRGFGQAPVRGFWSSKEAMARDLETLVQLVRQKYPDRPVYLLGHSMGAALVLQAMAGQAHPEISGAILAAPAVWARTTMPFYQPAALWLAAHTVPWFTVTGRGLGRTACSNIEVLREQSRDPLVIKDTRFDAIYGLQDLMDAGYAAASAFSLPVLVLYGRHDEIIPPEPVLDAYSRLPDNPAFPKQILLYDNGYHMLLRDLEAEEVMEDIVAWVEKNRTRKRSAAGQF